MSLPALSPEIEAAAFRRLLKHLMHARPDVQNIDLMIQAGFCRNCLAQWLQEAANESGLALDNNQAREHIYGMPFAKWKAQHQLEATPKQLADFAATQQKHNSEN